MDLMTWLPVAWFAVIGFGVLMYVVLDGFVLGIGILAPFAEDEEQLDLMMNTAAPIWDGNETWLVLGGAGLLAAFPKAYAVLLSALYLPVQVAGALAYVGDPHFAQGDGEPARGGGDRGWQSEVAGHHARASAGEEPNWHLSANPVEHLVGGPIAAEHDDGVKAVIDTLPRELGGLKRTRGTDDFDRDGLLKLALSGPLDGRVNPASDGVDDHQDTHRRLSANEGNIASSPRLYPCRWRRRVGCTGWIRFPNDFPAQPARLPAPPLPLMPWQCSTQQLR